MIISEGTNELPVSAVKSEHVLVLSALNQGTLNQMVKNFYHFLHNEVNNMIWVIFALVRIQAVSIL
ncbi:hypothetical protein [uncultured Legionella sp.]|uniref:hypothetical protein n=1 Tax=uncultured Legionella sp. TaxID=210934 RepID=UPI002618A7CC|nr:hypothetical protein [uncultured Legionella sp.]